MKVVRQAACAWALLFTACHVHVMPQGTVVHVPDGHAHTAACDHPRYDDAWTFENGHEHGPLCGHVYRDGRWEFPEETAPIRPASASGDPDASFGWR